MMEKRIAVPEGMLRAAWHAQLPADNPTFEWDEGDEMNRKFYRRIFEAALRWLSDNPQVPTMEQATEMSDNGHPCVLDGVWYATEWQRRMFLAPEPEPPVEIKDLLWSCDLRAHDVGIFGTVGVNVNDTIIEAFRRGQKSAVK